MTPETAFKNKVKKLLEERGCYVIKYWGGGRYTKKGVSDMLVCCDGRFIGLELKAPNGKPTDLQLHNLKKIHQAGGMGILLYPKDLNTFLQLLDDLNNKPLYQIFVKQWETIIERRMTDGKDNNPA